MFSQRGMGEKKEESVVGVAIDKDKGSQYALKWAVDHLLSKGQTVTLIHVTPRLQSNNNSDGKDEMLRNQQIEAQKREMFLPFRCFCTRKDIQCNDVILEDTDVAKAIIEYISQAVIDTLVIGASTRSAFLRFKTIDIPTSISKGAPDFCTVYVISKGKITSVRAAARPAPVIQPRQSHSNPTVRPDMPVDPQLPARDHRAAARSMPEELEIMKSPFTSRACNSNSTVRSYGEMLSESDISFVSTGRPSTDRGRSSGVFFDHIESNRTPRLSNGSDAAADGRSFEYMRSPFRGYEPTSYATENSYSQESGGTSTTWSAQTLDEVEAEMKRLKLELKQTMDMYSTACKEALNAKQKARELHRWKMEEEQRLEEARMAEEAAKAIAEKEKAKCKAAMEAAEAAQRIAELEAQKRINAEMKAVKEAEEKKKALDALANNDVRYRKYSIEEIEVATEFFAEQRKIGEGGYGPVYRCYLDHTPVAIKVLRPDAAQGRSQFQQEVEVLSCIRHPNMVLLLGACPEYGCLVYEYMANGSLEDRLFRRSNTPVLPWQLRFRIAAEIGTALLFLHQTKPEPLVHRDLKPANILLDRNFVSKISDVGLARLVPPNVADSVTQYRMTSTAGTFCYIDPEYQQTGMLGIKSDIYSLGIMLLQIITAKPPMGLTHHVDRAIERGTFNDMLDPAVLDWPVEEALVFAKLALRCSELRRKDRPDLGTIVLPELNRLRRMADETWEQNVMMMGGRGGPLPGIAPSSQDVMSDPVNGPPGYSSSTGKRQSTC